MLHSHDVTYDPTTYSGSAAHYRYGRPPYSPELEDFFAETLGLMASVPTEKTAAALADRCEEAVAYAPTPYFLARCAADLQVAGRPERAANFVTSLCKAYPDSVAALQQSTAFVATFTPAAGALVSNCSATVRP